MNEKLIDAARAAADVLDDAAHLAFRAESLGFDIDASKYTDCAKLLRAALEAAQREPDPVQGGRLIGETFDLAMLVRRLALALRKAQPDHPEISDAALDYLRRIGHVGGVLR